MQKIWLDQYPPGVSHEVDPNQYNSLSEVFEEKFKQFKTRTAYSNRGMTLTYGELEERSRHFANYLLQYLKLEKGDRVGIMLPNLLQFPVALLGVLRAGLIAVNLNPLYTPSELAPILEDAGIKAMIVLEQFANTVEHTAALVPIKHIIITKVTDLFPSFKRMVASYIFKYIQKVPHYTIEHKTFLDALSLGKNFLFSPIPIQSSDLAILQYTGGTTGMPKGVMLSHRNLIANLQQAIAWISGALSESNREIFVTAIPLYHIFSFTANLLVPFYIGAHNILITNPRDLKNLTEEIAHTKFSVITGVNTLYAALLKYDAFKKNVDFSHLKLALAGGMPLQTSVAQAWKSITKRPLLEAYGLSEASPGISMMPANFNGEYTGNVGLPWPSTEIDIRDENGQSLKPGLEGVIWVKGPQVMSGYWNNIQATREVLHPDGWLDTGDIGVINDKGYLSIVDRKKDMIIVSGFNVYSSEIELVLIKHPDIQEVAIVGVRDKDGLEIIKACIVPRRPTLSRQDIISYCRKYLIHYKIPKIIEFRESLPKSNVGKVLKRELR